MKDLFAVNSEQIMEADRLESEAVARIFRKKTTRT